MRNTHFIQYMQVQDGRQALVYGRLGWVCKLALVCDRQVWVHTQVQVYGRLALVYDTLALVCGIQEQVCGMQGREDGRVPPQGSEGCPHM